MRVINLRSYTERYTVPVDFDMAGTVALWYSTGGGGWGGGSSKVFFAKSIYETCIVHNKKCQYWFTVYLVKVVLNT